jgi:hypothetical protein
VRELRKVESVPESESRSVLQQALMLDVDETPPEAK